MTAEDTIDFGRGTPVRSRRIAEVGEDVLRALLALTAQRDPVAFAALHDELAAPTYELALGQLRHAGQATAVTQATFVEVWHMATCYDHDRAGVRAWVLGIARRRAADRVRLTANGSRQPSPAAQLVAEHDLQIGRELAALLASGGGAPDAGAYRPDGDPAPPRGSAPAGYRAAWPGYDPAAIPRPRTGHWTVRRTRREVTWGGLP